MLCQATVTDRSARTASPADGRTLSWAEWGDPGGAPVLSLHGTPGCRLLSPRKVTHGLNSLLASLGIRLVTYDRPGYGGSDRHACRRVVDCVDDVVAVADAAGVATFAVEGASSGAHHALAVAAARPDRVTRVAAVAPMAPHDRLGHDAWSRGQADAVRDYVAACLAGEASMADACAAEDADMRASAAADDPACAEVFEQTRSGLWGWIDDEVAAFQPWGFDPASVRVAVAIWHDPADRVLPPQHAEWLARVIPGATRVTTTALGHGSTDLPEPDWRRLYSWLAGLA